MRGWVLIAGLAAFQFATGQNLVMNPSFEERFRCPHSHTERAKEFVLPGWRSPNMGTPDYYNQCSWGEAGVPFNWAGESNAHGGLAYVGIYVWTKPSNKPRSYREYIQGELVAPLTKDKLYKIEFYFKLATYSVYTVDRIGLLLTDSSFFDKGDQTLTAPPTVSWIRNEPITSNAWELVSMEYRAHGGEQFLTIGNFFDNLNTQFTAVEHRKGKVPKVASTQRFDINAYFYIDDVSITPLEPIEQPLTWSDGKEIKPEAIYVLYNIHFEFDQYVLLPVSFPELDKLVKILNEKPDWRAELSGHTDDIGSEDYNLELSRNRAASVGQYLQSKGISSKRLVTQGYGKQKPLVSSKDENARTLNRRVEVRFIKDIP